MMTEFTGTTLKSKYPYPGCDTSPAAMTASFRFTHRMYMELLRQAKRQDTTMEALVRRYITEGVNRNEAWGDEV